jgi:hypothetical protein
MTEPDPMPVQVVSSTTDPMVKVVAIILGATLLLAVVAITVLALQDKGAPDVLQNVAVGALGALSALLVGNRGR